jgi:hypothetical protein
VNTTKGPIRFSVVLGWPEYFLPEVLVGGWDFLVSSRFIKQ